MSTNDGKRIIAQLKRKAEAELVQEKALWSETRRRNLKEFPAARDGPDMAPRGADSAKIRETRVRLSTWVRRAPWRRSTDQVSGSVTAP